MEDWETVDGSPDSIEKMLQDVHSHFLNKVAGTATGTVGWIFLAALKANIDQTLCNAVLVHSVQRHLEELEQCIFVFVTARTPQPRRIKHLWQQGGK